MQRVHWAAAVGRAGLGGLAWGLACLACGGAFAMGEVGCGGPDVLLCGQIPETGCPLGRGGSCDDEACEALYDCVDGSWTRVQSCGPIGGGGAGGGAGASGGVGGSGGLGGLGGSGAAGGNCGATMLDHTGEQSGCQPDLQDPDCPAVAAEVCSPCLTGCVDFFMCLSTGWQGVAFCSDEGELIVEQR